MTVPDHNFFRFATRELSHSAFWAWVLQAVGHGNSEFESPGLLGRRLLDRLGAPSSPTSIEVSTERTLPEKAGRADIWAAVDQEHVVIIENKRSSVPSRSQIDRYRNALARESRTLHICLLSTAFDADVRGEFEADPECHFVPAEGLLSILDGIAHDHPVTRDYHVWLKHLVACRDRHRSWALSPKHEEFTKALATPEGQWALLGVLTGSMEGTPYRGMNAGGRPWTQFRFVDRAEEPPDTLFYRIDRSSRGYYLSVRQYQGSPKPDWGAKKARLYTLRAAWDQAVEEVDVGLIFERPRNRGRNESEIAWLLFHRNPVNTVIEELPRLHEAFLARIRADPTPHG